MCVCRVDRVFGDPQNIFIEVAGPKDDRNQKKKRFFECDIKRDERAKTKKTIQEVSRNSQMKKVRKVMRSARCRLKLNHEV